MFEISQGFRSTSDDNLPTDTIIEFRTKTQPLYVQLKKTNNLFNYCYHNYHH